jgi:peptidoglycan hydrolase-like protein with peptidoglycan-binding domain
MAIPPTIAEGATGATVAWAQYLLVRRTLSCNQIDGNFGPVTKTAVEQFQRDSGLAADGVIGPATWGALGGDRAQPPTLAQGSRGPVVERLQTALNQGRGPVRTGVGPGPRRRRHLRRAHRSSAQGAQQLARMPADSIVSLQTWAIPVHAVG